MLDMTRDEYMAALRATTRILSPTIDRMMSVCPHLTIEQAQDGLMGPGDGYIALPPVKVRGCWRVANFYTGDAERREPCFNSTTHVSRTSWYADGRMHTSTPTIYAAEAMAYAETHWADDLIEDNWADVMAVYLQDPADLIPGIIGLKPRTKFVVTVGLRRSWNELLNDHSRPLVELLDNAIDVATVDPLISVEIKGMRSIGGGEHNCARCGGGLGVSECEGCGSSLPYDRDRPGWGMPLSRKLIQLLRENGHEFMLDPERLLVS